METTVPHRLHNTYLAWPVTSHLGIRSQGSAFCSTTCGSIAQVHKCPGSTGVEGSMAVNTSAGSRRQQRAVLSSHNTIQKSPNAAATHV